MDCACHPCAGAMPIFSVSLQELTDDPRRESLISYQNNLDYFMLHGYLALLRGWRNAVEVVLFDISNSMKLFKLVLPHSRTLA